METILKPSKFLISFLILFCLFSCDENISFSEYKTLEDGQWEANKKLTFPFIVSDSVTENNLFINIRNNKKYPFSNLYVITELTFPNGTKIVDTLQYEMADEKGKFLGRGATDIKQNKLYYKERKKFPQKGNYAFSIRHAMRKNGEIKPIPFLEGIQDVGFSIEKIKLK